MTKLFFLIMTVGFGFSQWALAQTPDLTDIIPPAEIAQELGIAPDAGRDISMLKSTQLQIVIHKAAVPEVMDIIFQGKLIYEWPTSTGRNQWETSPSGKHYFTDTPEGQFHIFKMVEHYQSITWNAPMLDAMFFDGGIAIHGIGADHYDQLGTPASGGCVRLTAENAQIIWDLVHKAGTRNTIVIVTSK